MWSINCFNNNYSCLSVNSPIDEVLQADSVRICWFHHVKNLILTGVKKKKWQCCLNFFSKLMAVGIQLIKGKNANHPLFLSSPSRQEISLVHGHVSSFLLEFPTG